MLRGFGAYLGFLNYFIFFKGRHRHAECSIAKRRIDDFDIILDSYDTKEIP